MKNTSYDKLNYYQEQNKFLKDKIQDLEHMIKINKVQIQILTQINTKISSSTQNKQLLDIIYNYRQIQQSLSKKLIETQKMIEQKISEKLVFDQLNAQLQYQQIQMKQNYQYEIKELKKIIKNLEQKINIKDQKIYDNIAGLIQKKISVYNPTEQVLQFYQNKQKWQDQIEFLRIQLKQSKSNEQKLLVVNTILRNKVISLQAKLAMPNKNLQGVLDRSFKRLILYFIDSQKKMLLGDNQDSQNEDDIQLIAPELLGLYQDKLKNRKQNFSNIPSLDLLKIIPQDNQKKDIKRCNNLTIYQKLEKFQIELNYTRRQLTKNLIQLKQEIQLRKSLKNICQELENRNLLLIQSQQNLEKKAEKYWKQLLNVKKNNQQFSGIAQLTSIGRWQNKKPNFVQNSPKENNWKNIVSEQLDSKIHLELLDKQLKTNKKLINLSKMKIKQNRNHNNGDFPTMKRSTSNPYLYDKQYEVSKREQNGCLNNTIYNQCVRFEQTELLNNGNYEEYLDNIQI